MPKLMNGITKLYCVLALALFSANAFGLTIIVPSPRKMLESADIVAVGTLEHSGDAWYLNVLLSLKGKGKAGDRLPLTYPHDDRTFSFPQAAEFLRGRRFLFVGNTDKPSGSVRPTYDFYSFWPQGRSKIALPQRTLNECVAFAAELLGVPEPEPLPDLEGDPASTSSDPPPPEASAPPVRTPPAPAKHNPGRAAADGQPTMELPSKPLWIAFTAAAAGLLLWLALRKRR